MEQNLKAIIRYDGTDFSGWQVQPDCRTVQGELQRVLSKMAQSPIQVNGAGRTDAGVHAFGQVCSFRWPREVHCEQMRHSLSQLLRPDIRVESVEPVEESFHARHSAIGKHYAYTLCVAREEDPFASRYAFLVKPYLKIDQIESLAKPVIGEHDFAGYQCVRSEMISTVRTIHSITFEPGGLVMPMKGCSLYTIHYRGTGFLYKMIRNLTGTFWEVLNGRAPADAVTQRLASPGPYRGYTAPPQGLCLVEVFYKA